jgi:hypothetical protein
MNTLNQREYYWIVSSYGGKLVVIGPKNTSEEASEFAYQKLDSAFEIVPLKTRDRARATSQIKAMKLDSTGNLGESIQRAKHQI